MKKIVIKLTSIVLLLCLCSSVLVSCTWIGSSGSDIPKADATVNERTEHKVSGTIHYGYDELKDTGIPFCVDGATEYKIVYDESVEYLSEAAVFIISNINNATGVMLEKEENPSWDENKKYIVIGDAELQAQAGVTMTDIDLKTSGYQITTKGNSVFLMAKGDDGYNMGAIAFLRIVVGYDALADDLIIYEKDGSYIPEMNIIECPDIDYRQNRAEYSHAMSTAYSMGMTPEEYLFMRVGGKFFHNELSFLNPEIYSESHPEWYTMERTMSAPVNVNEGRAHWPAQLCHTAHGDAESLELMYELISDQIVEIAMEEKNLSKKIITVTQEDEEYHCPCEYCSAIEEEYGSVSAIYLLFVNEVARRVEEKLIAYAEEHNEPVRELKILMFAYQDTRFPPTKLDEKIKCRDNVGIYIAPSKTKYSYTFYDSINKEEADNIIAWSQFGELYFFTYRHNAENYFYPCNVFSSTPENFRFLVENNAVLIGEEGGSEQPYYTGFAQFKEYITSRLNVDVNLDFSYLKEQYFKYYFGDGGTYMLQFFEEMQAYMSMMRDSGNHNFDGRVVTEKVDNREYWPYQMLVRWQNLCDLALKEIEKQKISDPEMYEVYKKHILIETIFPRYALCTLYEDQYTAEEIQEMRVSIYNDCEALGFKYSDINTKIDSLWEEWGVK